jgi:hypothetical protein
VCLWDLALHLSCGQQNVVAEKESKEGFATTSLSFVFA